MTLTYDGTFHGFLTAVFEAYERKGEQVRIIAEDRYQPGIFEEAVPVVTDQPRALRVLAGLKKRSGKPGTTKLLYRVFLTEAEDVERVLWRFIQRQLSVDDVDVSADAADENVRRLLRLDQQMGREVHRIHAFVRFQETADGMYASLIEPDFNCLPLVGDHFAARYPAMEWLIFDVRRQYGLQWDVAQKRASFITLTPELGGRLKTLAPDALAEREAGYQSLWKAYFKSVDIQERRNDKLHLQHVPRRYWKYLTEK